MIEGWAQLARFYWELFPNRHCLIPAMVLLSPPVKSLHDYCVLILIVGFFQNNWAHTIKRKLF
jgi:hypothetical protein